jgi:hypothetical protein
MFKYNLKDARNLSFSGVLFDMAGIHLVPLGRFTWNAPISFLFFRGSLRAPHKFFFLHMWKLAHSLSI